MASRPVITVYDSQKKGDSADTAPLPAVFSTPIRLDVVRFVHDNLNKNHRQPYAVKDMAGHGYSAESWGTGRAVARIPRIGGSGTGRAAQGAFGNMCRGGRMFAPTKIWRKWHRHVNLKQKRFAVAAALAATAVPSLVMARGHRIDQVVEVPLVLSGLEKIERTKDLLIILKNYGAGDDLDRVEKSKALRAGKGKSRNRRFTFRKGPLVIYEDVHSPVARAARNIPGVDVSCVHSLNLLKLAPGGTLGRFVVWSAEAFAALNQVFGTETEASTEKKGFVLPRSIMSQADVSAIAKSDAVQAVLRDIKPPAMPVEKKKNPYKNAKAMEELNPFHKNKRRLELIQKRKSK